MRNLKRALSLALASVMLLGMMVVGTSAASYPDVDEKDNVEAIEVLNAVQVMIGDRGNFRPDAKVNRHEMAVIMAKLVLGNEAADNYVGSHPFTDVFPWADKYVAACYENGLVSGTSATTFSGNQPLTAVQAAAMMLRALGYKDLSKGASDWRAPVTAMANQIRLFNGVASNPKEELDRNQVAQLALNTLKSPVVTLKDNTFDITSGEGNVVISGGSREYIVRSSSEDYAYAINSTEYSGSSAAGIHGATVELGEHLYNGDLKLRDNATDAFGRPSRKWEYDGKTIGTYMKKELMDKEWTNEVTGKDLYDLLGSDTVKYYDIEITIDGVDVKANKSVMTDEAHSYFDATHMAKTYKSGVGQTGKGVLTQVFVDPNEGKNGKVWVSVINTYLAKATSDYNEKKDEIKLDVYGLEEDTPTGIFYKFHDKDKGFAAKVDNKQYENLTVAGEDFAKVTGMKKDDIVLVTVANGDVKTMADPKVLSAVELSEFSKNSYVVSDQKYEYNTTIDYDPEVLEDYTGASGSATQHLKDTEYNLYLDPYGYLAGIEVVEAVKNYIFLTGIDQGNSNLNAKTSDAAGILLDGTFINFKMNMKDSKQYGTDGTNGAVFEGHALWNTWCTYTKDKDDVYTLKQVGSYGDVFDDEETKSGQFADFLSAKKEIDTKHVSLIGNGTYNAAANTLSATNYVYGNDDSIYMLAETKEVTAKNEIDADQKVAGDVRATGKAVAATTGKVGVISGVSSVETGIDNVGIVTYKDAADLKKAGDIANGTAAYPGYIYTLFDNDGYVIAAIVLGEDNGASKNLVYSHKGSVESEKYDKAEDEWTWTRKVIKDGKEVLLTQKGNDEDITDGIEYLKQNVWYEVTFKADGTVKKVTPAHYDEKEKTAGTDTVTPAADYAHVLDRTTSTDKDDANPFVSNIEYLENAINNGGKSTVLYEEVWGKFESNDSTYSAQYGLADGGRNTALDEDNAPSLKKSTLYVNTDANKGFYVSQDVKSVLIQKNHGSSSTSYGEGMSDLEGFLKDLNYQSGSYLFKISAVLTNGRATTVIIHDWNETGASVDDNNGQGGGGGSSDGVKIDGGRIVVTSSETEDGQSNIVRSAIMTFLEDNGYTLLSINTATNGKTGVGYPTGSNATKDFQVIASKDGKAYTFNSDLIVMVPMTIDGKKVEKKLGETVGTFTAPGTGFLIGSSADDVAPGEDTGYATSAHTVVFADKGKFVRNSVFKVDVDGAGSADNYYKAGDEATVSGTAKGGNWAEYTVSGVKKYAQLTGDSKDKVRITADMATLALTGGFYKISVRGDADKVDYVKDDDTTTTKVTGLTGVWVKTDDSTHKYIKPISDGKINPAQLTGTADPINKDIEIIDQGYYKITGVADVAEADAAVITGSTAGKYSYTSAVGTGTIEKVTNDFYGKKDATIIITFKLKTASEIGSTKTDTITVTAAGTVLDPTTGKVTFVDGTATDGATASVTVKIGTADATISLGGGNA